MWIFIIILLLIALYIWLFSGSSPYDLTMVIGKKGSGKTCFLVHEILKYYKKGWVIYTDFHVNIPHIRIIDPKQLGDFYPVKNSLICLDEVGITWNNRNFKNNFTKEQLEFWKYQRHCEVKVIFASQTWDIDLKLRQLTDRLYIQRCIGNKISISIPVTRKLDVASPDKQAEEGAGVIDILYKQNVFHWKFYYMPRYFKYFDSFYLPEKPEIPYKETITEKNDQSTDQDSNGLIINVVDDDHRQGV